MTHTYRQVSNVLNEVVEEYGTNHISNCFYRDDETGEPVCLVGHVLAALEPKRFKQLFALTKDVPTGQIAAIQYNNGDTIDNLMADGRLPKTAFSPSVLTALAALQERQDGGDYWGTALDAFNQTYKAQAYHKGRARS